MRKILSVDDDPKVLQCFETTLKRKGYDVHAISDPTAVAEFLQGEQIDLVMLDIRMPKKSGFEIFKELKKKYRHLPVLFVTAYPKSFAMDQDETMAMWTREFADGNTDVLYKPFELQTLYDKIEGLIGPPKGDPQ
ncbi:MAG: response regulator [Kiritimatiellae bacterium]|nr:response regulator [Kiritimatiellia bacterium]